MKQFFWLFIGIIFTASPAHWALAATGQTSIPFYLHGPVGSDFLVTGTPRIPVDVGGVTRYANYSSGSFSNTLTFIYQMQAGDVDLDGVIFGTTLDLNGGTITDLLHNPLDSLTIPTVNTTNVKANFPSLGMDFVADADGRYTLNGTVYNDLPSFLTATGGTFTRASIGTYYDSTGTIQTATAGTPRFDYDPVTHAPKGILIEEQRTNLSQFSSSLSNASWGKSNVTVTYDGSVVSPDGSNSTSLFNEGTGTTNHRTVMPVAGSAGTYTSSIYLKAGSLRYVVLGVVSSSQEVWACIDTQSWTIVQTGGINGATYLSSSLSAVGNGWYRGTVTGTLTNTNPALDVAGSATSAPNAAVPFYTASSGTAYLWGAQLEQGAFATSYIPTTTAAVTRLADNFSIPTGSWYNQATGSVYSYSDTFDNYIYAVAWQIDDGSSLNRHVYNLLTDAMTTVVGGTFQTNIIGTATSLNTFYKTAYAYQANDFVNYKNGTANGTDNSGSIPTVTALRLGKDTGTASMLNGHVSRFKYYPTRVPNTQLQLMTQ